MNLKEIEVKYLHWIRLAEDTVQGHDIMHAVKNLQVLKWVGDLLTIILSCSIVLITGQPLIL